MITLNKEQEQVLNCGDPKIIINASAGTGKSLQNGTLVLSSSGWKAIENLTINDKVAARDGNFYNVLGVFPQGLQDVWKVTFSDRTEILCSADHLWIYQTAAMRQKKDFTVDTLEYINNNIPLKIKSGQHNKNNCYIPMTKPINFVEQETPLDPYLLGCLLGDGGLSRNGIKFTVEQEDLKNNINEILSQYKCQLIYESQYDYTLQGETGYGYNKVQNMVGAAIRLLNLSHTKSDTKFIPDIYKYNSVQIRLEVLKGLIDTDGYCEGTSYNIILKSKQMILDIKEICESLGMTATYSEKASKCYTKGYEKEHGLAYRLHIKTNKQFPKLHKTAKREQQWKKPQAYARRYISDISPLNYQKEMTCISVDSPDKSFICENYIVTHNTSVLVEMANRNKDKNVVMITFTNRAAEEMVARLDFTPYFIGTIHAFALHQLRILAQRNGFRIRLINKDTIRKIIKLIFKENDFGVHVSKRLIDDAFLAVTNQEFEFDGLRRKVVMKVKDEYNKYKQQNKVYDLTDAPDYLLEKLNDLNITLSNELVLVDEAQDLNMSQYELIQKLGNNIVAIGDPKQSIYLFRGASPDVFNRFEEEGYTPFTLTQNYRSKQEIIDFAEADLICDRGYGGEIINDTSIFKYGPQILCRRNEQVKEIEKYYPSVMTIHAAKGLEFDNVCLVNFDEESLEDANVKFVAQTRARDRLAILSYYDVVNFISRF